MAREPARAGLTRYQFLEHNFKVWPWEQPDGSLGKRVFAIGPEDRISTSSRWIIVCLVLALTAGETPPDPVGDEAAGDPTAKARLEIAREAYRELYARDLQALVAPPVKAGENRVEEFLNGRKAEEYYQWSRRCMEAERDLKPGDEGNRAALKGHLDRMKSLEEGELFKDWFKEIGEQVPDNMTDVISSVPTFAKPLKFFRLEAESWLAKATKAKPEHPAESHAEP